MMWIAHTLQRGVTYGTASSYVTGIKHVLRLNGVDVTVINSMQLLKQLMQAAQKVHSKPIRPRLPITHDILSQLRRHVLNVRHNGEMLWAAFTLAVAALLRCGEITVNHTADAYLPLSALKWHTDQRGFTLTLPRDKTHDVPVAIDVYMTGCDTCPVRAMRTYLQRARAPSPQSSPLFITDERRQTPLTRRCITQLLPTLCAAAGIAHAEDYKGHSFRRGGATSLARSGAQWHTIKKIGRWKSDAYQLYIVETDTQFRQAAVNAATHHESYKGKNVSDPARSIKR